MPRVHSQFSAEVAGALPPPPAALIVKITAWADFVEFSRFPRIKFARVSVDGVTFYNASYFINGETNDSGGVNVLTTPGSTWTFPYPGTEYAQAEFDGPIDLSGGFTFRFDYSRSGSGSPPYIGNITVEAIVGGEVIATGTTSFEGRITWENDEDLAVTPV